MSDIDTVIANECTKRIKASYLWQGLSAGICIFVTAVGVFVIFRGQYVLGVIDVLLGAANAYSFMMWFPIRKMNRNLRNQILNDSFS